MSEPGAFRAVADASLGYERSRTAFPTGQALRLDESYRLAHLPLVAPMHQGIIPRLPGKAYEMGHHGEVFSLVLPVDAGTLEASAGYRALLADVRRQPFARKISWDIWRRRGKRLHATVCGGLPQSFASGLPDAERSLLAAGPSFDVELRGLFSGNVNLGRLYLKLYPEKHAGQNSVQAVQRSLQRRETDLYPVGLFNLVDDLDIEETASLAALIERWWNKPVLRFEVSELWLLGSKDDLVLDSRVIEHVTLAKRSPGDTAQVGGRGIR